MSKLFKVTLNEETTKELPTLHIDDTIDTLKRKIILAFDEEVSYDSLYIYVVKEITYVPELLFKELSQNGRISITYERLANFLLNFEDDTILAKLKEQSEYSIGDLYNLQLNKKQNVRFCVGMTFKGHKSITYPFVVDPLLIKTSTNEDQFLQENAKMMTSTQNSTLVMDIGNIKNSTFRVLTAEHVLEHMAKNKLKTNIQIYFPFLDKEGIDSIGKLRDEKEKLLEKNSQLLSKRVKDTYAGVDLFYDLAKKTQYPQKKSGIIEYDVMIHQTVNIILPLEQLFKILHSAKSIPFIKFNPGFRRENLLRLYTEEKTIDGTKIPFLSKAMIIKLIKIIGKSNTISLYLDQSIVVSIFENGSVRIIGESDEPLTLDDIVEKLKLLVNPILEHVKKYVQESGFDYDLFKSFDEENVEVITMTYTSRMEHDKKLDMKPYMSCISTVFNVTQDTMTKKSGIQMRYKRVANFNEMSAVDAFIREVINKGEQRESIIEKVKDNFGMSIEDAEAKFIAFVNEVDVEQTIFQNRKLRIKDNPGFAVTIDKEKFTSNIILTVSDIDNVQYIELVKMYLSSLLTMVQGIESDMTKKLCKKKAIEEEEVVPEIVAEGEKPFGDNKTPEIVGAKELIFDGEDDGDDDMLDMLLGSDDEEDEDMNGGSVMYGGADTPERDITGMSLSNPNYFSKRMEERDPSLFLKKKEGKFNAYSRMCPSNIRRQPVILTEEEKERIDKTHPDSYTHSIKYGSDPTNPYYYICPRYWCIPKNTSLSEEEVKAGVCGGEDAIIPFNAKKVPKGKTIYEFGVDKSNKSAHAYKEFYDEDGNYIEHHPGFISGKKHPDGKCMPCCFKSWTATEQVRRRQECSQEATTKKIKLPKKRPQTDTQRDYIKGEEKFPLEQDRWGYLPIELQMFFGEDSKKYQVSALDPSLKDDAITLLRQGVESHKTQSFIACIADIYSDYSNEQIKTRIDKQLKLLRRKLRELKKTKTDKNPEVLKITREIYKIKAKPSIVDMKKHIISFLSLDNYTSYQNGNLVSEFYKEDDEYEVSIDDYQDTQLYKKLDTTDDEQVAYMEYIIKSFENFIEYLNNDTTVIDYQYLWDIVCIPNDKLFPNGINLVIFEIPEDDVTGNVEILCPTNHYSTTNFSDKKLTLMLVKKNNFFEPIYLYNNMDKKVNRFLFREQNLKGNPNIKVALTKIREYMNSRCRPLNSLPNTYFFETNKPLDRVLMTIEKQMKKLESLVIHYNGKAIGLNVELISGEKGYIPCYPSSYKVSENVPILFMDDTSYMKNYIDTKMFLEKVHKHTKLPISPQCKVVEDNMVVGILTKSNQVIPLKEPEVYEDDDIELCNSSYSIESNKKMVIEKGKDTERIKFTNALDSENKNYTAFRNLARIELNMYKNQKIKTTLLDLIDTEDHDSLESYTEILQKMISQFKKLLGKMVRFEDESNLEEYVFPEKNILTGKNNEVNYYMRLADEALRYQRIKLFLFEKNRYLSFSETMYKLNDDEILILESMISQEYFEGLKAYRRNMYVHNNTYDTALPILTKTYSDKLTLQKCIVKTKTASTGIIKQLFGPGYSVKEYGEFKVVNRTPLCSFDLIRTILQNEGIDIEIRDIKELLVKFYSEIDGEDFNQLIAIMYSEGKEQWIQNIRGNKITLDTFIMSDDYYLTTIDLWMLATQMNLPIAFLGKSVTKINGKMAYAVEPGKAAYYFIRLFSPKRNTLPRYELVESPETLIKVPFDKSKLPKVFIELVRAVNLKKKSKHTTIGDYIKNFNVK